MSTARQLEPGAGGVAGAGDDRIAHLRKVVLFTEIERNEVALARVASLMREITFRPGAAILREGETGSELFILIRGNAGVYKSTAEGEEYIVALLSGEHHVFFGEGALLDSEARSATIKAETECLCLVLERKAFEIFSEEHPQLALPVLRRIARAVMARLRKSNGDLMLLYNALVAEIRGG